MSDKWYLEEMTYEQRIDLGTLFAKRPNEDTAIMETYKIIYNKEPSIKDLVTFISNDFKIILEGIKYWIDAEGEFLSYSPTGDEISAGIEQMQCPLSTAVQIGKDFGMMPNDVLKRPYSEIFTILWSNAEISKYERKLNKIISKK